LEEFINLEEVTEPDERHGLIGQVTGCPYSLEILYKEIEPIILSQTVPEGIRSQFNVTKNLALYTWFSYSLSPVVDLKTYINIEYALKLRLRDEKTAFGNLIGKAVDEGLINDAGFRHIDVGGDPQEYSKRLVELLPRLRNRAAHGSKELHFNCVDTLRICADFINQLF